MDLNIPDDIRIMAYDDSDLFRLYHPSITAVSQPIEEISNQVINILLQQLEDAAYKKVKFSSRKKVMITTNLIVRASSVAVRNDFVK